MSMTSNVIVAKVKSMNGNALGKDEYEELLRKKSLAEIASYLKHETMYANALKDVRENYVHRGQLEDLLRKECYIRLAKLYRYSEANERAYYLVFWKRLEIDLILSRIRVLISQKYEEAIVDIPMFLKDYTSFDLEQFGHVKTFDELLKAVRKTPYYDVLLSFRIKEVEHLNYSSIETALLKRYYAYAFDVIDLHLKNDAKKQAKELFASEIEWKNIVRIFRYKKYFNVKEDEIRASLLPFYHRLSKAAMEKMIAAANASDVIKIVNESRSTLHIVDNNELFIETSMRRKYYEDAHRLLYYSSESAVVFTSYLIVLQQEIENLISIIEGARYGIDRERVEKLLIF